MRAPRTSVALLCAFGALAPVSGCSDVASDGDDHAERRVDAVYETRGQIVSLPDPMNPASEFMIHHEAIDRLVWDDGTMRGMDAMVMPFPAVADNVSLDGIEVGDVVRFSFDVAWEGDPKWKVISMEEIDPGTELIFRQADPSRVAASETGDETGDETGEETGEEPPDPGGDSDRDAGTP